MTTTKLDWALHYAGKGLAVFPVRPNSKHPLQDNWPDLATSDPAQISEWWEQWPDANIGAHPGASGHVVIDVDTKKVDGFASLKELEAAFGVLPETMQTVTPTGGRHVWLSLEGSCRNSAGSLAAGIDTRGVRGFVLMGGSSIDGREYSTDEAAISEAPDGWRAPLYTLGAKAENRVAVDGVELDHPGNIERAQAHVKRLIEQGDVAVAGSGGNDRTYRLASALRDFGLTQGTAQAVAEPWNEVCVPPWDEFEFETIFDNAYNYAQNEAGAKALADPTGKGFASVPMHAAGPLHVAPGGSGQGDQPHNRFTLLSIEEMADLPEPSWLIPDWLPHYELSMIFGPYGSFKSFAAVDMGLSIAAGVPCLDLDHKQKAHPVVYLAGEGQIGVAKQRVPAWIEHRGLTGVKLPFHMMRNTPLARNGDADLAMMFQAIEQKCGEELPRLVIIDTHARSMSGLDENTVQDTSRTVEFYEKIAKRYSCAVLLVHHSGLDGQRERGSTALGGACSTIMHMEYDASTRMVTLACKKMKDAEPPKARHLTPSHVGPSIVLTRKDWETVERKPSHSELYNDVFKVLNRNGAYSLADAMTTSALAAEMQAVTDEPTADGQEKAKRKMVQILEKSAKKELRPLVHTDEKPLQWHLPPIPPKD